MAGAAGSDPAGGDREEDLPSLRNAIEKGKTRSRKCSGFFHALQDIRKTPILFRSSRIRTGTTDVAGTVSAFCMLLPVISK